MDKKYCPSIKTSKARSFPGADIGRDHDFVLMTFKMKLKKVNKSNNVKSLLVLQNFTIARKSGNIALAY